MVRSADMAGDRSLISAFARGLLGQQPEQAASYLYDGVVIQAGAIGWAFHTVRPIRW